MQHPVDFLKPSLNDSLMDVPVTNSTEMPFQNNSDVPQGVLYNSDVPQGVFYESDVPQELLYIPAIVVAASLILLLGISFVRYHLRMVGKRKSYKEYVKKDLHIKRDRLPGYVITPSATALPVNPVANDASIIDSYHAMPLDQDQEHRNMDQNKPQRSNLKSNQNITIQMTDFDHNVVIPFCSLCNDCKENVHEEVSDSNKGQVNVGFLPDQLQSNDSTCSNDSVDDDDVNHTTHM